MSSVTLSRRHRPGHDQLRGRVCRHARPRAAVGRHPQFRGAPTGRAGRDRTAGDAAVVPLSARASTSCRRARRGCRGTTGPTGSSASLPGSRGRRCPAGWSAAPRAGSVMPGSTARPTSSPGVARPRSRRSRPSRPRPSYLRHIRDAWNDAFAQAIPVEAARTAGGRADGAGLVRRGGPRADDRGRQAGGAGHDHAARRAAGGVLLLDRLAPGPLAARGPRRRADPGLRHRRRHDRLQPDHGRRDADRAGIPPRRRRRSPDARRR